jgi:hypothetical protein
MFELTAKEDTRVGRNQKCLRSSRQLLLLLVNAVLVTSTTLEVEIHALQSLYNSANGINWGWRDVILFGPKWNFSQYQESINPCSDNGVVWQGSFLFDRFVNNYFMHRIAMLSRL